MVYPFVVLVGTSHLIDMTTRRALVYDCVGSDLVTNAMALESIARTAGAVVGGLVAGAVISALGIGEVFLVITFLYCLSTAMVLGLSSAPSAPQAAESPSFVRELTSGLRYVRSQRPLLSILGVTILINVFYFPFQPMLPIFGDRLGVSAFWAGLLLSAHGLGSAAGASVIANGPNLRKGAIYTGGSAVALAFLFLFAAVSWYPIAVLSLLAAGFAIAGFGTMQSVLVMVTSDDAMRGRAMGILSMSIGVLPFSTLLLGALASVVGPAAGVMINASIGLLALMAFSLRRPEAHRLP